jgi:hypothetical protein
MPVAIIKGKEKKIPFNARRIAFMVHLGTTVLPDPDTPESEAEEQNNQVIAALQKLRHNLSKRKANIAANGKQIEGFADGGFIDPESRFQKDSKGAIRFDDYSDIGTANVQASGVGSMAPHQTPAITQPNVSVTPVQSQSTSMPTSPVGTRFQTDRDGAIRFDDYSDIGQANSRAAGVGSMTPPQSPAITQPRQLLPSNQISPLNAQIGTANSPIGSQLPIAGIAGNQSLLSPEKNTHQLTQGTQFQTDNSGSIRFDDHSAIGLSNLGIAGIADITHPLQPNVTQPGSILNRYSRRLRRF